MGKDSEDETIEKLLRGARVECVTGLRKNGRWRVMVAAASWEEATTGSGVSAVAEAEADTLGEALVAALRAMRKSVQ